MVSEPADLAELAAEYRDALMRDIGVVGIEHAASGRDFGDPLRARYPVERAASATETFNGAGNSRILYSIADSDDGGESVSGHPESRFATVRETTGMAAIQSSATLTLCWRELPSPREILVAEYLEALGDRDLRPEFGVSADENVAERLVDVVFDSRLDLYDELPFPWLDLADVSIGNTEAIKHHVAGVLTTVDGREGHTIETVRFESDHGRDAEDGPFSRWAADIGTEASLAAESYSTGWGKRHDRAFIHSFDGWRDDEGEWFATDGIDVDGWGYVDGAVDTAVFGDDDGDSADISTRVVCIPECRHPGDVLDGDEVDVDLGHASPETPLAGPREDGR
jgi:hypothetical protein